MASVLVSTGSVMKAGSNTARLKLLRSAPPNSWIAMSRDSAQILAVGRTFTEADRNAKQAGAKNYFLTKTPDAWIPRAF